MFGRYLAPLDIPVWWIDIALLYALLTTIVLAFLEKFVNFKFIQIINSCCFSNGNDETQTQNPLIPKRKANQLCFLYESKFSEFNSHYSMINAFVRICSVLLHGISNQQAKMCIDFYSIITWSNHSFHDCGISTLQHLLLLSSHKPSNFSLVYGSRYSRMDQVKFMEDSL